MPVCLHCGEIGSEGALFCAKCGYTLPQPGAEATTTPLATRSPVPGAPVPAAGVAPAPVAVVPPRVAGPYVPSGVYAAPAPATAGAVGPMSPPPNAKYCSRCGTAISAAAVYCPVCQNPQA